MMVVHPSGYNAWKAEPASVLIKEDRRLYGLVKQFWLESGGVYGYRKITDDLRDSCERCGKHRKYRLMKVERLRAQAGYRRRQGRHDLPSVVAPNQLKQYFDVAAPTDSGSLTSPTSARMKAGGISPWCWICFHTKLSAG